MLSSLVNYKLRLLKNGINVGFVVCQIYEKKIQIKITLKEKIFILE